MKTLTIKPGKQQKGYVVVLTIAMLAALLTLSLSFFERATGNMKLSGHNRDSVESLLLAEAAMNSLYGRYVNDQDIDNDGTPDQDETWSTDNPVAADVSPLHYVFFLSNGVAPFIGQTSPQILQRIANGEAIGIGADTTPTSNLINNDENTLLISELFVNDDARPVVFTLDAEHKLQITADNTTALWIAALNSNQKIAAAWFELVRNDLSGKEELYVEAVAIVGKSRSYIQRIVTGEDTALGIQSAFSQASL